MEYKYRQGGLMRCCTLTLAMAYDLADRLEARPKEVEGEKLPCRSCSSTMIFNEGAWEWDKSRAPVHGVPIPTEAELAQ